MEASAEHNRNVAWKHKRTAAEEGGVEVLDLVESELPGLYTSGCRIVPLAGSRKVAVKLARVVCMSLGISATEAIVHFVSLVVFRNDLSPQHLASSSC